ERLARGKENKLKDPYLAIGLVPSQRSVLHTRIASRYEQMLNQGLENEVSSLRQQYPTLTAQHSAMRCVGYRQIWAMQEGLIARSEHRERGIYATRQLAKRQLTWLNNSLESIKLDCLAPELTAQTKSIVGEFLDLTPQ
ncbi:MAG: tRNA (adenosine(37)-N6)-dimethylallyltransferase MiaA, partial [Pseudomonadota bacterium]